MVCGFDFGPDGDFQTLVLYSLIVDCVGKVGRQDRGWGDFMGDGSGLILTWAGCTLEVVIQEGSWRSS